MPHLRSCPCRASSSSSSCSRLADARIVLVHQGRLFGADDQPVNNPALPMSFRITDQSAQVASEVELWQGSCEVVVREGFYAVTLGDDCGTDLLAATSPPKPADTWK